MNRAPRSTALCAAVVLALAVPAAATAAVIVDDGFNYNDGSQLVGQGGWQAHSAAGARPVLVNQSNAVVVQTTTSGEDINKRWFVARSATDVTYASFNLMVPSGGTIGSNEYFAHFRPAPTDTNGFVSRVFIGTPATSTNYTLSVSNGTTNLVAWVAPLDYDRRYKVVLAYDAASGQTRMWVDPASESDTNVMTVTAVTGKLLESFALRQATATGGTNATQLIGDIIVATTFAEAIPAVKEVPVAGGWSLALIASSLALGGATLLRLRRRA